MDSLLDLLREAGRALAGLFTLPYFYLAILFVWWHARQGTTLQRRLFHVRLRGSLPTTLSRLGAGAVAGVAVSAASFAAGARLDGDTLLCVWIAMAALALLRLRLICLAYAAGALGILQALLDAADVQAEGLSGFAGRAVEAVAGIDVPGILFLAGLLHVAEGLLVRIQGARNAIPLFVEGKRGKPMGAYALAGAWPVPLLWLVPAAAGTGADGFALPWEPLFGGGAASWALLAFPVLIGFGDRTETFWPEQKAKSSGYALTGYGIVLALLAAGAVRVPGLTFVASIASIVLHEGLVWWSRSRERGRTPLYTHDGTGVRILAVLPGTPAAEMELAAGEIIRRANGVTVRTKEDLHAALQRQSAFSKLEVANREGHVKFVQRARYAGEHHQLGLILAPDEDVDYVAGTRAGSIWQSLRLAGAKLRPEAAAAREALAARAQQAAAADAEPGTETAPEEPEAFEWLPDPADEEDAGLPPRGARK